MNIVEVTCMLVTSWFSAITFCNEDIIQHEQVQTSYYCATESFERSSPSMRADQACNVMCKSMPIFS